MNLIRSIKINKLGIAIPEKELEIINFVNSMLSDLTPFKYDNLPKSMFYFKGDKWLVEQDDLNDMLWVRFEGFWEILQEKYSIEHWEIKFFLKYMIEKSFKQKVDSIITKRNVDTLLSKKGHEPFDIDNAFKKKISIPTSLSSKDSENIELSFKINKK